MTAVDYGIKSLRQVQMSRETAIGMPGATWFVWRGPALLDDQRVSVFADEDIGIFGGVDRQYFPQLRGELSMPSHAATFEQIGHLLDAALGSATPAQDGAGSGYVRTYTMPLTAAQLKNADDYQTYHIKAGDNVAVDAAGGAFVKNFGLAANRGEALMLDATWETQEVAQDLDGFETATIPTVEEILFLNAKLYIDSVGGTIGTTPIVGVFKSMGLTVDTGLAPVYTGDGSLSYSMFKLRQPEIVLNVEFEHTAAVAAAERENFRTGVPRLLRIDLAGTDLGTSGTYTTKLLRIDAAGKWANFQPLGEDDGDDICTGEFRVRYNATAAKFFEMLLVNEVATL